jgi:hypothetical protein
VSTTGGKIMHTVIRNGEYIHAEKLIFGDIEVPQKPHENAVFENNEWIIDVDYYFTETESAESLEFLNSTDWQIIRHKEEQDLGLETSLSDEEYLELITKRNKMRGKVNNGNT